MSTVQLQAKHSHITLIPAWSPCVSDTRIKTPGSPWTSVSFHKECNFFYHDLEVYFLYVNKSHVLWALGELKLQPFRLLIQQHETTLGISIAYAPSPALLSVSRGCRGERRPNG